MTTRSLILEDLEANGEWMEWGGARAADHLALRGRGPRRGLPAGHGRARAPSARGDAPARNFALPLAVPHGALLGRAALTVLCIQLNLGRR